MGDKQAELSDVKKRLKKWEAEFVLQNDHKPDKNDINAASDDIKDLYRDYYRLKREIDSALAADPWSTALNKKPQNASAEPAAKKMSRPSVMQKISSKLRMNIERFANEKDEVDEDEMRIQRLISDSQCSETKGTTPKRAATSSDHHSEKVEETEKSSDSDLKPKNIFEKALVLTQGKAKKNPLNESLSQDSEVLTKPSVLKPHFSSPFLQRQQTKAPASTVVKDSTSLRLNSPAKDQSQAKPKGSAGTISSCFYDDIDFDDNSDFTEQVTSNAPSEQSDEIVKKRISHLGSSSLPFTVPVNKTKSGLSNISGIKPYDPESEPKEETVDRGVKRKRLEAAECGRRQSDADIENELGVDVGWCPDPRDGSFADLDIPSDDEEGGGKSEGKMAAPAYKRARMSGPASSRPVSNDNFIRLNMKVKRFTRGGGKSGGYHKRMAWKQKMQARAKSYGDNCFKCGGSGHWANKCKGNRNKPSSAVEETERDPVSDADFPSIQEAVRMAKGIKKKPVKPSAAKESVAPSSEGKDANKDGGEAAEEAMEEDFMPAGSYEPRPAPPTMEPLYQLQADGSVPPVPKEVYDALNIFGHKEFRHGQEQAIMRILCGQSTLVVISTGGGKSLCYQLPAYMYAQRSPCITLVISPLVSLMEDQVMGLPGGLKGACLHTSMTKANRQKVIDLLTDGEYHFLLISPESLVGGGPNGLLPAFEKLPPIAFACIDEAHCVSEWSHHFRPSYLRVCKVLEEKLGVQCMLGLTATATKTTAVSVAQHLQIDNFGAGTIRGATVPDNLMLSVSRDEDRDGALIGLLHGDRFRRCKSIIIYCTRREQTNRLATLIRTCMKDMKDDVYEEVVEPEPEPETAFVDESEAVAEPVAEEVEEESKGKGKGKRKAKVKKPKEPKPKKPAKPKAPPKRKKVRPNWDAEAYHAGLSACQRRRVQNDFMCGALRVVVATVAFGMGLDKSDVRGIIHYNMPKSYEGYVQEIGRAGRDGKPAHCHLFLDQNGFDIQELKRHIHSNTVDRYTVKKLAKQVFAPCKCRQIQQGQENVSQEAYNGASQQSRVCPGHERAIPIDDTVRLLDMREEGISTLLIYLELHPSRWVENLSPVYATCQIQCYAGPQQLYQISQKCAPIAVAIAREKKEGVKHSASKSLRFPVVQLSDSMGWHSSTVKREIRALQWNNDRQDGYSQKSGVLVEFCDLAFHLMAPGDLSDDELDTVIDFLSDRVTTQERTELVQLHRFYEELMSVAHKDIYMCSDEVNLERSEKLKTAIRTYFDQQPVIEQGRITQLTFGREYDKDETTLPLHMRAPKENMDQVRGDVRQFINMYGHEHTLSGRTIARIFHGIASPNFPAEVWGRVRRFWRCNLNTDFNVVRLLATKELTSSR